ncbi:unnamed protein product [Lactuca virosa]|uniref:Uncharacterized protein n=1 Tax=Lactuca virosa TaxID=75947 RepID=A0AAU9PBA1_9ASTR|nr:unnamed protein product [Lactuca virosa]
MKSARNIDLQNMEGLTTTVYKSVKGCWRARGYQRLGTSTSHDSAGREEEEEEKSGSKSRRLRRRKRRFWRFRINPRLTLKLKPRKLFIGIRDAYMMIMMKLASSSVVRGRTMGGEGFGTMAMKEYDEKMIMEIYKTLAMRQGQLIPSQNISV